MSDNIKLVPIAHRVHERQMAMAHEWFGWRWMLRLPIVFMRRRTLENWTWDAVDHAVYRTARVFRGEELP